MQYFETPVSNEQNYTYDRPGHHVSSNIPNSC